MVRTARARVGHRSNRRGRPNGHAIQSIVSRNLRPIETAVVSITQLHSGDAYNVIPHTARLSGTVRAFSQDVMKMVETRMKGIAEGVAGSMGAQAVVDFGNIFAPTINNPTEAEFAAKICNDIVGAENVERNPPLIMASEDFSFMLEQVPGCYVNIGNGGEEGAVKYTTLLTTLTTMPFRKAPHSLPDWLRSDLRPKPSGHFT